MYRDTPPLAHTLLKAAKLSDTGVPRSQETAPVQVLVVSFSEVKACIERAFSELMVTTNPDPC